MVRHKNKKYIVRLDDAERLMLTKLVRAGKSAAVKLTRARVLLLADEGEGGLGQTDEQIAASLQVGLRTVGNLRERCVGEGLEAALERKPQVRPSRRRKLDGDGEARLVALACSQAPDGRSRWTLGLLGDRLVALEVVDSISPECVRQTLKKTR